MTCLIMYYLLLYSISFEVSTLIRPRSSYYFADLLNKNFEGLYKVKFLSHTSNLSISSCYFCRQAPHSYASLCVCNNAAVKSVSIATSLWNHFLIWQYLYLEDDRSSLWPQIHRNILRRNNVPFHDLSTKQIFL